MEGLSQTKAAVGGGPAVQRGITGALCDPASASHSCCWQDSAASLGNLRLAL